MRQPVSLAINVSDTVTTRERLAIESPRRDPAGHRHKAAVTIEARDDYYHDDARGTWLEHVWDRERDIHIETRRDTLTRKQIFRKRAQTSQRPQ
jgi:hypothetical protein